MTDSDELSTQRPHRQNIEQERGRQAWADIREIQKMQNDTLEKEYRSLARGFNAMIQINGLGQTLGFLKAKSKNDSKKAHYQLLKHLTSWMQESRHFPAINSSLMHEGYDGLLRWLVDEETSSADYRRATTECLSFGTWLRRFAEGELKEPVSSEDQP